MRTSIVPTARYLRVSSGVYMIVIRRIFTGPRFGPSASDIAVRREFGIPSVDCLIRRARLRFLGRLVLHQPPSLIALLGARHRGKAPPWVELIVQDLVYMKSSVGLCSSLPEPGAADAWCVFILEDPARWISAINAINYVVSAAEYYEQFIMIL